MTIEAVVQCWSRRENPPRILAALRAQSVPVTCTLIDACEEPLPTAGWDRALRTVNRGPWNRYRLADRFTGDRVLFLDDDIVPVPDFVHRLATAPVPIRCGLVGAEGEMYGIGWGGRLPQLCEVDFPLRSYLWERELLLEVSRQPAREDYTWEDDILAGYLAWRLGRTAWRCYTRAEDIPGGPESLDRRPDCRARRVAMIEHLIACGWRTAFSR